MTGPRDPDRLVHAFFQEGPAELSARSLEGIRAEVGRTSQQASWRRWRTAPMARPILVFVAIGAVILAFGAMFFAGSAQPSPAPSPSPAAAVAPASAAASETAQSPSPTPAASPTATPYPLAAGEPWIAIESGQGIQLVRSDGGDSHHILSDQQDLPTTLGWSTDGTQLTYEGNGRSGSQVWIANADGTGARQLTPTPDGCPLQTCTEGVQPAWSPDGKTIAYIGVTHQNGLYESHALQTVDVATGRISTIYSTDQATLDRPSWAPDSRRIVFGISRYPRSVEVGDPDEVVLAVADTDKPGAAPTEITKPALLAGYPSWHPTDDRIVLRTNRLTDNGLLDPTKASDLYVVDPDGTNLTQVTDFGVGGAIVRAPSWTPDGRILFSKLDYVGAAENLRLIAADGSGETSATGAVETVGEGRWRPGT